MKVLYAIQGTGNGHLSRARDIIPALQKKVDLDILVSGIQADVDLPFPIKYRLKGMSFIFGKKGGVDLFRTFWRSNTRRFIKEIMTLPVHEYDLIINDFEPVSAWASFLRNKNCISLSHQASLSISSKVPKPDFRDTIGSLILKYYAPVKIKYGFHFKSYDQNIFTPVIREQVRNLEVKNLGHYTVYLPAYEDEKIIKILKKIPHIKWQVFSKHNKKAFTEENIQIQAIENQAFIESMASSEGVLCGAGFETPAEALFLNKKLMVIPMKGQYEQHFNAAALNEMNIPSIKSLKKKHLPKIESWISTPQKISIYYPNQTERIISIVLEDFLAQKCEVDPFSNKKLVLS